MNIGGNYPCSIVKSSINSSFSDVCYLIYHMGHFNKVFGFKDNCSADEYVMIVIFFAVM